MKSNKSLISYPLFYLLLANIICFFFTNCSSDPLIPEVTVAEGSVNYFINSMDFPASGGSKTLNFTSNVDWTLKPSDTQNGNTWCSVSQSSGEAGTFNISITASENVGYDDRNVVLILTAGDSVKTITVNQKYKEALLLTADKFEVGTEGGTIEVEAKSNINYDVEIPEEYSSWIMQTSKTRALSSRKLSFNIAESKEYDKREGKIIFTSGDITETVTVYQAGSTILVLSNNDYTVGSDGGIISIDISSNFQYEIDMPNVDWIKVASTTRAVSSHTLKYEISTNSTYDDREATIVFKDSKSEKKESVTIKQRQKDAILLSNDKYEIGQEGGTFNVDVNSNVDYSIEIPSSCSGWLSKTNAPSSTKARRVLAKSTSYFKVASSEQYDKREGMILFKYNNIVDTLKVYQSGGAILLLSESSYNLEGDATTISVQLKSNIDYSITSSVDWITEHSTRAISSYTKTFNIARNLTGKSRTGNITFKTSDGSKSATVNVTQAPIVVAKSIDIKFTNTSGTIGDNLYIGKNYGFSVTSTPSNAVTELEWKVADSNVASISGNGSNATLTTKSFGKSKVIVTDKISGATATYEFGTAVTNFQFTETSKTTKYGYPVLTLVKGYTHQLKYSCSPSSATKVFSNLKAFNFKELNSSINTYVIVDNSSIVDIDENGLLTAKNTGTTIISANNSEGIYKSGSNDGIVVEVVNEITSSGSFGGHEYVDLGLPSGKLWATENFGGWSSTDYGSYYMWSSNTNVSSYWGSYWSTPTKSEFDELMNYCSYKWTTKSDVYGYLFTGANGATMFLPAAGFKNYIEGYGFSKVYSAGSYMLYWTSSSSSYTWEGQTFAFALQGNSSSLTASSTYNTTIVAAPIRPIAR